MNSVQQQPPPPSVRDWTQPIEIRNGELGQLIVDSAAAGWQAVRLDVVAGGYRVTLAPMTECSNPPARREFKSFTDMSQPKEQ